MNTMAPPLHALLLPADCFQRSPAESGAPGVPEERAVRLERRRVGRLFFAGRLNEKPQGRDGEKVRRFPVKEIAAWLLLAVALWWLGNAGYIHAKAWLGQQLLERAWSATQRTQMPDKPWPWADTAPVARLIAPTLRQRVLVLRGANGRTIAWGPGWREDSALPGGDGSGNSVIVAHRDTHFRFLKDLRIGDPLDVETARGEHVRYRVRRTFVVDAGATLPETEDASARLTLVTCYPFDTLARDNRQRYVVEAVREDAGPHRTSAHKVRRAAGGSASGDDAGERSAASS